MTEFTYPLFRLHRPKNLIVMFTDITAGEIIQLGDYMHHTGYISSRWTNHEASIWEPCADPRISRTNKMLKHLKSND